MGSELSPGGALGGTGGWAASARGKDETDKLYQEPTDFMPMDGQSPQSRQLIEN